MNKAFCDSCRNWYKITEETPGNLCKVCYSTQFKKLENKLFKVHGTAVSFQPDDYIIPQIIGGQFFTGFSVSKRIKGVSHWPSECHHNASVGWFNRRKRGFEIVTGWACNGGVWGSHSFNLIKGKKIAESQFIRELYFGKVLNFEESVEFFCNNFSSPAYLEKDQEIYEAIKLFNAKIEGDLDLDEELKISEEEALSVPRSSMGFRLFTKDNKVIRTVDQLHKTKLNTIHSAGWRR